jgi:hypothetical protein
MRKAQMNKILNSLLCNIRTSWESLETQTLLLLSFSALVLCIFNPLYGTIFYSGDHAIFVMMANKATFDAYDTFFWGQDRLGAWTLYLNKLLRSKELDWSPNAVFGPQFVALMTSLVWLKKIACSKQTAVWLILLTALCANPFYSWMLFDISMPYGWSIFLVTSFWIYIRTIFDRDQNQTWLHVLGISIIVFLSTWLSPLNIIVMLTIFLSEMLLHKRSNRIILCCLVGTLSGLFAFYLLQMNFYEKVGRIAQTSLGINILRAPNNLVHILTTRPGVQTPYVSLGGLIVGLVSCLLVANKRFRSFISSNLLLHAGITLCAAGFVYFFPLPF